MTTQIQIKRIYEPPEKSDGHRILVDRLWPRGIRKDTAAIDDWFKELAPSSDLRKWYQHDPEKWQVFQKKYLTELHQNPQLPQFLKSMQSFKKITLVFAAKDMAHSNARVLQVFFQNLL